MNKITSSGGKVKKMAVSPSCVITLAALTVNQTRIRFNSQPEKSAMYGFVNGLV